MLESTLFPLSEKDGHIKFDETEIQALTNGVKAIGVGMGLGKSAENEKLIRYLMSEARVPLLLDADALNTLAKMDSIPLHSAPLVLTPHLKELERLAKTPISEIQNNPVEIESEAFE